MNQKSIFKLAITLAVVASSILAGKNFLRDGNAPVASANFESSAVATAPLAAPALLAATRKDLLLHKPATEKSFAQFQDWVNRYSLASKSEKVLLESEGIKLAAARRQAMAALIRKNPERAIELTLPYGVRRTLPDSVVALLEERVAARGRLAVLGALAEPGKQSEVVATRRFVTIGDRKLEAYVYGWRLGEPSRGNIPLNGVAVNDAFALNENPVRILEPEEAKEVLTKATETICSISSQPSTINNQQIVADVGGQTVFFCSANHAVELKDRIVAAEGGGPDGGGASSASEVAASSYTEGQKKLILIRVDFTNLTGAPFSDSRAVSLISSLNDFYSEMSFGRASFALNGSGSDFTPTFRMPHPAEWYGTNDNFDQLRTDARSAANAAGYTLGNYNFDMICMGAVQGWGWSGLGYIGATGAWLRNSSSTGVAGHELGHNFGLNHANFWDTGGDSIIGDGTSIEYGDDYDTMGAGGAGINHFNSREKSYLNWLTTNEAFKVTSSGTYRIQAHDDPGSSGLRALKIARNSTTNYWVEFRQKFTGNKWMMNGAGLRWGQNGNQRTLLLDTTPGSPNGKNDSALVIGRTFSDDAAGVHITPVGKGGTSPESLDVVVNLGTFPGNFSPVVNLAASATNASTDTTLTFTVNASDSNGDTLAYNWDFGDGNFGTNGATVSKSWGSTGDYVVRCDVSDMKGGVGSRFVVVRIGSPSTFRISGTVATPNGVVQGVRVSVSSSIAAYTDSDGHYTIAGLSSGNYNVTAILDGFTFTNANFSNPVNVGPSAVNINFLDGGSDYFSTVKPTLTITSPAQNARVTNSVITIQGTTSDNSFVTNALFQLNGGDWSPVVTANNFANWSADSELTPGTNTILAIAFDDEGNVSPTNSVSLVLVQTAMLTVQTNGNGSVSPNYNGQLLEIGRSYSMTATPGAGYLFQNWSGDVQANTAKLTFIMQNNLALQANFVPNQFAAAAGTYNGLFSDDDGVSHESSGFFSAKVTSASKFTGKISMAGKNYSIGGQFNSTGKSTNLVLRAGLNLLTVELDCTVADQINGRVTDGNWSATLLADKALFNALTNPAPLAARYTMNIPGSDDTATSPGGNGFGAITVDAAGKISFKGTLADGTKISQKTLLSKDGHWPFYVSVNSGGGSIISWVTFANTDPKSFDGELVWTRHANPLAKFYPLGFTNQTGADGAQYIPPPLGDLVLDIGDGIVWFSGGNHTQTFSNNVTLGSDNKIINTSSNTFSMKLTVASGLFSGKATDPLTLQAISFKGALSQRDNAGHGFFLGTNQSGSVLFQGN